MLGKGGQDREGCGRMGERKNEKENYRHTNGPVFINDTQGSQVFYSRFKLKWEAHWDLTQTMSRWAKGLGEFQGKVRSILSLRPRREHRAGEPRLCSAGQDVL